MVVMWKFGFASVVGTAHGKVALPVQDASHAEIICDQRGHDVLIAVASDGAGSATQAQIGSRLACDLFVEAVKLQFAAAETWPQFTEHFIADWIEYFQQTIHQKADEANLKAPEFACTLLAAIIGGDCSAYFQLGDGAMVVSPRDEPEQYRCVCWPQQGEYANTTNFLTDADAAAKVFCEFRTERVDEVAVFTDGLQNLVLDYRTQSAHSPFFASLFAWLRAQPPGYSQELSSALTTYLNSDKINARTDDDKTLMLASRK